MIWKEIMLDFIKILFGRYSRLFLFALLTLLSQNVFSEESTNETKKEEKSACDEDLKKRIRRQIAFKMSVVSPAASQVINQVLDLIPGVKTKVPSLKID